jgi:prophage DNA circulation protein
MGWREQLQLASFRGFSFSVISTEIQFGRKSKLHEFPFSQKGFDEDLGRKLREFSFNAYLSGDNYLVDLKGLLNVIENNETSGTLIHPSIGSVQVKPTSDCKVLFDNKIGGREALFLSFVESGDGGLSLTTNFLSAINDALTTLQNNTTGILSKSINFIRQPQQTFIDAQNNVSQWAEAISVAQSFGSKISNLDNQLQSQVFKIQSLSDSIFTDSNEFGSTISSTSTLVSNSITSLDDAYTAQKSIFASEYDEVNNPFDAGSVSISQSNIEAMTQVYKTEALGQMAKISIQDDFRTSSEARTRREEINDFLDSEIERVTIDRIIEVRNNLINIKSKVNESLFEKERILPDQKFIEFEAGISAYRLANNLFGDSLRAKEIARDNNVLNPLFLPAGEPIKYFS